MTRQVNRGGMNIEAYQDIRQLVDISLRTTLGEWWADEALGMSLQGGKLDQRTSPIFLKSSIEEALAWMVEDGIVSDILVETDTQGKTRMDYLITLTKPDGDTLILNQLYGDL